LAAPAANATDSKDTAAVNIKRDIEPDIYAFRERSDALAGVAKINGTTAAAKVSAAIPPRVIEGMSAMIFLRRLTAQILRISGSILR
jgi:hypothetical protein